MKIYLVYGFTGEWESCCQWNLKAFKSKKSAEKLALQMNEWCRENNVYETKGYNCVGLKYKEIVCPNDSKFQCYDFGVKYSVEEIDLE